MISFMLLLPILGSFVSFFARRFSWISYALFSVLTFGISLKSLLMLSNADGFVLADNIFGCILKFDSLSSVMILLASFLFLLCTGLIYNMKNTYIFAALFLLMQFFVNGLFVASDLLTFFIFFESVLIPMFFIIGCWGGKERIYSSFKFFIYTFAGSVLFLISTVYLNSMFHTLDIYELSKLISYSNNQSSYIVWMAFFVTFLVKIPCFPFHTWLPNAHVQAPTAGSVVLAGILIKIGTYCLIRILLQMMPEASVYFAKFAVIIGCVSIVYASVVAYTQKNIKTMIAYSSIAHMGFVVIGIFSLTKLGLSGAIFQMISHGFISAALFMCIGILYARVGSYDIGMYGGIADKMPKFALLFVIFAMGSMGLPGTSGFVGEFMSIAGLFKYDALSAMVASSGVFLGALYMLKLLKNVIWGSDPYFIVKDAGISEIIPLYVLSFVIIVFGLFPSYLMTNYVSHFVDKLFLEQVNIFLS